MKDRKIRLACPACERKIKLRDSHIGKPIICPKCNTRFRVNKSMVAEIIGRGSSGSKTQLAQQDKESVGEPSVVKAAFEDIDLLFSNNEIASHVQQIETNASQPVSMSAETGNSNAANQWQSEKQVSGNGDEKLARNGIGLLILAAGLALLPIFGASVPELSFLLPYLPVAALAVAFLGTFMLTYSKRRRGFGTIILSLFPLVFIGLASAGGHFYLKYLAPSEIEEIADQEIEDDVNDDRAKGLGDDLITIDRDSINQNPATKFVAPNHNEPAGDHKHSLTSSDTPADQPDAARDSDVDWADNQSGRIVERPVAAGSNIERPNLPEQQRVAGTDKRDELLNRIDAERLKSLVSRGEFRGPGHSNSNYSFSKIAGETTVYGVAYKTDASVRGFDFLTSKSNSTLELVVPLVDKPQYLDSQFAEEAGQELVGINIHRQDIGIIGLQGVFVDINGESFLGNWAGTVPEAGNYMTVRTERGQLAGFVMYRNGLRTVGFGLVTRNE